jgi:hypothetical protein
MENGPPFGSCSTVSFRWKRKSDPKEDISAWNGQANVRTGEIPMFDISEQIKCENYSHPWLRLWLED